MGQNRSLQLLRELSSPLRGRAHRARATARLSPQFIALCGRRTARLPARGCVFHFPTAVRREHEETTDSPCGLAKEARRSGRRREARANGNPAVALRGATTRESGALQKRGGIAKWGRHRCRPHSHRCVVPPKRALGIRRFPRSAHRSARVGSVAGARTGIRKHPPVISPDRSGANPFATMREHPRQAFPQPDFPHGRRLEPLASDQGSSTKPPRASDRSARPVMKRLAPSVIDRRVLQTGVLALGNLGTGVDSFTTSFRLRFVERFQTFRPAIARRFRPVPMD
jgi:hypothetical protein